MRHPTVDSMASVPRASGERRETDNVHYSWRQGLTYWACFGLMYIKNGDFRRS